jgi:hypothetical protein
MKNETYYRELLYSTFLRATGKSELLGEGVKRYNKPFNLVCGSIKEGVRLTNKNPNATYITPNTLNQLSGNNSPIIFDQEEVLGYLRELMVLKSEVEMLRDYIKRNNFKK